MSERIDAMIGERIRQLRIERTYTPLKVAKHLNIQLSHYQKLEAGLKRTPSDKLYELSKLYSVPMDYFFGSEASASDVSISDISELIHLFRTIHNPVDRKSLIVFARKLSEGGNGDL